MTPTTEHHSGSANSHSRLAPSSAKRWPHCTASVAALEANRLRILPVKISEVRKLKDYLLSMPEAEVFEYEWAALRLLNSVDKGLCKVDDLTEGEIDLFFKASGSVAAREGTRAHEFATDILLGKKTLADIPEGFREPVGDYVRECQDATPDGVTPYVEEKAALFYSESPDDTGTCDFAVILPDRIIIKDLKYGQGVKEYAFRNPQLMTYARSFIEEYDSLYAFAPETVVELTIVQPRHRDGASVDTWEVTLAELREHSEYLNVAAKHIRSGGEMVFAPSEDTCRWCDMAAFCEAKRAESVECFSWEVVTGEPEVPGAEVLTTLPVPDRKEKIALNKLSPADRVRETLGGLPDDATLFAMWQAAPQIRSLLDDIGSYINDRAMVGDTMGDRVKLVLGGQGNRKWADETAAETFLKNQKLPAADRYKQSLISPTEAEKLLKGKMKDSPRTATRFEQLITRSDARPTAAPADDKRPALGDSLAEGLGDETSDGVEK